jgi:hypothetical protein
MSACHSQVHFTHRSCLYVPHKCMSLTIDSELVYAGSHVHICLCSHTFAERSTSCTCHHYTRKYTQARTYTYVCANTPLQKDLQAACATITYANIHRLARTHTCVLTHLCRKTYKLHAPPLHTQIYTSSHVHIRVCSHTFAERPTSCTCAAITHASIRRLTHKHIFVLTHLCRKTYKLHVPPLWQQTRRCLFCRANLRRQRCVGKERSVCM